MKRLNKNFFVFIIIALIVVSGMFSIRFFGSMFKSCKRLVTESNSISEGVDRFINEVENNSSERLRYHDLCMNINSLFGRITGARVVEKDDMTIVRAENDYLTAVHKYIKDKTLEDCAGRVQKLYEETIKNDANFLYVMAPQKGYDFTYPSNVESFANSNCDRYAALLKDKGIPFINLLEERKNDNISIEEMYFVTDHHWKPTMGFWAYTKICEKLNRSYGFPYVEEYTDLSNYQIETYKNWFLGSQGKKVGCYFSPLGTDDFDLITPKFKTSLTEEQPIKDSRRTGDFTETVLYKENLEVKNYYMNNPYATYSGGDFRLQIITNHLNPDGETVMVIRDSYACAVTPFLALNASKIYVVDIRNGDYYVGDRLNVFEYMKEVKPDNVVVLYCGAPSSTVGTFDFDK